MSAKEECEAVTKLQRWMTDNKKTQAWIATRCGVRPPSVYDWLRRVSRPAQYLREIIAALTNGEVAEVDWELPSERTKRDDAIRQIREETDAA